MADTTLHAHAAAQIEAAENLLWPVDQRSHSLDQARLAAVPSRFEEDWRKTDPELFPWQRVEQVSAETSSEIRSTAPEELLVRKAGASMETLRQLAMIPGDDFDSEFLYYHKAFSARPVLLRIPRTWSGNPIEIEQRTKGPGLATFTTFVEVDPGAQVTIIDRWMPEAEDAVAIGRMEILVGEGATLNYIQEDRCGARASLYRRARIQVATNASASWYSFTTGAAWHAARMELMLMGPGSAGLIKGLFAGAGDARADHRTHQYHGAPNAKSDLTLKTLLTGRAHSIYQGLISVPKQSQKTDAYQQCRNLLLDPGTRADAIPKLEIIADDVRCTHGVSMGSLNKEQLFYLQSRGLSRGQALRTIGSGFAEEIIAKLPLESVQERWRIVVAEAVESAATKA